MICLLYYITRLELDAHSTHEVTSGVISFQKQMKGP